MVDDLDAWISTERSRFENRDDNSFAMGFGQVSRYRRFLGVISERYAQAAAVFLQRTREFQEVSASNQSADWWPVHIACCEASDLLHLEIESFYVFAKILLDKLALCVAFYFGQVRCCSLASHDKLVKNWAAYASTKGLRDWQNFDAQARALKERVSEFRDKSVEHEKSPRTTYGTVFDLTDGKPRLMQSRVMPKESDTQAESEAVCDLLPAVDAYILVTLHLLESNRQHTNLRLLEHSV